MIPPFYSLHKQIIKAMEDEGAIVSYIPDVCQKHNPYYANASLKSLKKKYYALFKPNERYIQRFENILRNNWDIFFCIDGYSFSSEILTKLRKNKGFISVLYLWDSLNFYDFRQNFKYFDIIYTFDPIDAKEYKIKYLPLYWTSKQNDKNSNIQDIDISFVGTFHTDRFVVLTKIAEYCKSHHIKYSFNLVINGTETPNLDWIRYNWYKNKNNPEAIGFVQEYLLKKGMIKSDIVRFSPINANDVKELTNRSKCIIDIVKPNQHGCTNRMIEALGNHKKVITTMQINESFPLTEKNILYIDRNNPLIDRDFIEKPFDPNDFEQFPLDMLNINNWIKTILS